MEIVVKRKFLKMKQGWRQASKQVEAGLERSRGPYGNSKNCRNQGAVFWPKKGKKKQPRNMGLPSSRLQLQMWLVLNLKFSARMDRRLCNTCTHMKGPKLDPPDGTTFDFEGVHFLTLSGTCLLSTGGQNWTLKMLNPVPPWRCRFRVT